MPNTSGFTQIAAKLWKQENEALTRLKKQKVRIGDWVRDAIREKLERDGILPEKKK